MVTRQARIDAFHEGVRPTDQFLELLCEGHVGTSSFLSRVDGGAVLAKRGNRQVHRSNSGRLARALGDGRHVHGQILNI